MSQRVVFQVLCEKQTNIFLLSLQWSAVTIELNLKPDESKFINKLFTHLTQITENIWLKRVIYCQIQHRYFSRESSRMFYKQPGHKADGQILWSFMVLLRSVWTFKAAVLIYCNCIGIKMDRFILQTFYFCVPWKNSCCSDWHKSKSVTECSFLGELFH